MEPSRITALTEIRANKDKTWEYYTDPVHIIKWNMANEGWCCPKAVSDMKSGGKYYAGMEAKRKK